MERVLVEIPAKRYVKRFIEQKYGAPALLDRSDSLGKYFYQLVEKPSQEKDLRFNNKKYPEYVTIALTQSLFFQRGFILTPTNIIAFNNFVECTIFTALEFFICGAVSMNDGKIKKTKAYEKFLDTIRLTENDFPYETIKKRVDRNGLFKNT
jgi:hypothetical protein